MDKHTPLTKITKKKKKAKLPPEERQYSKNKNQNYQEIQGSLNTTKKNKYHYDIEQKLQENFLPRHD